MNKPLEFILTKKIFIFIFIGYLFSQYVFDSNSDKRYALREIKLIEGELEPIDLLHSPYIDYKQKLYRIDFLKNNKLSVAPVIALRYSKSGFEMDSSLTNDKVWMTPGVKIRSLIPITYNNFPTGITIISWFDFYKHSAYGLKERISDNYISIRSLSSYLCNSYDDEERCSSSLQHANYYFKYNPLYFNEYASKSKWPDTGIDFDESKGGVVIDGKNFDLFYGKFRSSIGPFKSGNLSISQTAPSFQQLKILWTFNSKYNFSYLIGSLNSNVIDWDKTIGSYNNLNGVERNINYFSYIERYIVNHRFDYRTSNFRIGFYEQVIFGSRLPLIYLNPITFYWSAQHQLGDLDNLQMGFDMEYLNGKNRFYFAFMADEWAPFNTFRNDAHNWFATQIGISRLINISSYKVLLKHETTLIDPQVYSHKFPINEPKHHNYYLGFWTGSDSENYFSSVSIFNSNYSIIFSDNFSLFGLSEYHVQASQGTYNKKRRKTEMRIEMPYNEYLYFDCYISNINSSGIYNINNYIDVGISIRFGIDY